MKDAIKVIDEFNKERDWDQFHTPVNIAKSISIEAGELLECFQWSNDEFNKEELIDELADVQAYCIMMAESLGVDLEQIVLDKYKKNAIKYSVHKSKGNSTKYDKFDK